MSSEASAIPQSEIASATQSASPTSGGPADLAASLNATASPSNALPSLPTQGRAQNDNPSSRPAPSHVHPGPLFGGPAFFTQPPSLPRHVISLPPRPPRFAYYYQSPETQVLPAEFARYYEAQGNTGYGWPSAPANSGSSGQYHPVPQQAAKRLEHLTSTQRRVRGGRGRGRNRGTPTRRGGGRRGRGAGTAAPAAGRGNGFSQQEVESLHELLEEHLPIGRMEWEAVMRLHTLRYPTGQRTVDSLRRKFAALHRETVPTGSPTIPADVSKAKEIKSRMGQRADMGEGDDFDDDDFPGYESNGDHDEITRQSPQVGQTRAASLRVSSPIPLTRRRSTNTGSSTSEDSTIMDLFRMQMMQDREMIQEEREKPGSDETRNALSERKKGRERRPLLSKRGCAEIKKESRKRRGERKSDGMRGPGEKKSASRSDCVKQKNGIAVMQKLEDMTK